MRKNQRGFTLIELMIVVGIVGIITAIAYPSYQEQLREGRRSEARSALLGIAQAQERFYTVNGSYTNLLANLTNVQSPTVSGYYILATTGGATFTATATPTGTDADCTTLTLTHVGVRDGTGADPASCW